MNGVNDILGKGRGWGNNLVLNPTYEAQTFRAQFQPFRNGTNLFLLGTSYGGMFTWRKVHTTAAHLRQQKINEIPKPSNYENYYFGSVLCGLGTIACALICGDNYKY